MSEGGKKNMGRGSELLRDILIGLHETEGVGWTKINNFMACRGREEASAWREGDWLAIGFRRPEAAAVVRRLRPEAMEERRCRLAERGIRVVTRMDPDYPSSLEVIAEPPWVLYALGDWSLASRASMAVVGTRTATAYGRRVAEDLSAALSAAGFVVVSGMARGIDTAAHIGAMSAAGEAGGGTIAVLGTPVDQPYPAENRGLYRQILAEGLVLSEVPPDSAVRKGAFLWRNRIIAGLSHATVVVEAGAGSGALNTAEWALKYSRGVFAVPGPITSPKSIGVLRLTRKDGVKLLIDAEELIAEYAYCLPERPAPDPDAMGRNAAMPCDSGNRAEPAAIGSNGAGSHAAGPDASGSIAAGVHAAEPDAPGSTAVGVHAAGPNAPGANSSVPSAEPGGRDAGSPEERRILRLLEEAPRTIDELAAAGGIPVGRLHAVLIGLQIAGRVVQRPGCVFEIV
jgi:DNA processing protein